MRPGVVAAVAAWFVLAAGVAPAAEGVYRITGAVAPVEHVVNGYTQSVTTAGDGSVTVSVSVPAMSISSSGERLEPRPSPWRGAPPGFELPRSLRTRLAPGLDPYARATEVLRWARRSVDLDATDEGFQDAASVMARGRGRCSGVANAIAALLSEAGFESRTISGLLVTPERAIPHRWVECRLPGAGWVPTDPAAGYWVVTARHLVFADTVTEVPEVEVLAAPAGSGTLPVMDRGLIRPDRGAELVCRLVGGSWTSAVAVLRDRDGDERRTVLDPEGRFSRLIPGSWLVEVVADGRVVARRWLELGPATSHSVVVDLDRVGRS
jgi:hypothetical protein